jgi:hypothetical protein
MLKRSYALISVQILLSIVMLQYIYARSGGLSTQLFWPLLWAMVIINVAILFTLSDDMKMASIIVMSVTLTAVPLAALPQLYIVGRDDVFEAQYGQIIARNGAWDPHLGAGFAEDYYGYNPAIHFIIAFNSLLTGIDAHILTKYLLFILIRLMLVLLVFLISRELIGNKMNIVWFSSLIFVGCAGLAFIGISRRTMASVAMLVMIYAMLRHERTGEKKWVLAWLLFAPLLVIANHTIAYYFMAFMAALVVYAFIVPKVFSKIKFKQPLSWKLVYYTICFLVWELINSALLHKDLAYIWQIKETVTGLFAAHAIKATATASDVSLSVYHSYELFVIFAVQAIFLLLAGIGFLIFAKSVWKGKKVFQHDPYMSFFAIVGLIMYVVCSILMRTELDVAAIVILWFFSVPICILVAYFLEEVQKWKKTIHFIYVVFVMLLLFTGSLLMGMYTPRLTNRAPLEDIVIGSDMRSKTQELFASGKWLAENRQGNTVLGDTDVYEVYGGFYLFDVNSYDTNVHKLYQGDDKTMRSLVLRDNIVVGSYKHTRRNESVDYMIINKAFSRYYSRSFGAPIEVKTDTLDSIELIDKVYDNRDVMIYKSARDI